MHSIKLPSTPLMLPYIAHLASHTFTFLFNFIMASKEEMSRWFEDYRSIMEEAEAVGDAYLEWRMDDMVFVQKGEALKCQPMPKWEDVKPAGMADSDPRLYDILWLHLDQLDEWLFQRGQYNTTERILHLMKARTVQMMNDNWTLKYDFLKERAATFNNNAIRQLAARLP